jgi:prenyltransferase beta subunit
VHSLKIKVLGLVRYLRPDDNPLRRPLDRAHSKLIVGITVLFILAGAVVAAITANLVNHAGLRAELQQARTRHSVEATVMRSTKAGSVSQPGLSQDTRIRWVDRSGATHTGSVAPGDDDRAGGRREVWIDQSGELTARPRTHHQTLTDTTLAALASLAVLGMLHAAVYSIILRRIDRRRLAMWEREWVTTAPRWTGRS